MDAYAEDSGKYQCIARNSVGSAETVCNITIQGLIFYMKDYVRLVWIFYAVLKITFNTNSSWFVEPQLPPKDAFDDKIPPQFKMLLPNRTVPEGFELTLVCAVTGTVNELPFNY